MTVDAAGDLWVAVYGGGRVHRYSPEGELLEALPVPAAQSTCCAFGGPRPDRLYVTTATEGWSDEQRRAEPAAGLVYRLDTDATGDRPRRSARTPGGGWERSDEYGSRVSARHRRIGHGEAEPRGRRGWARGGSMACSADPHGAGNVKRR